MFFVRRQLCTNGLPKEPAGIVPKPLILIATLHWANALQFSRWRKSAVELLFNRFLFSEQSAKIPGTAVTNSFTTPGTFGNWFAVQVSRFGMIPCVLE